LTQCTGPFTWLFLAISKMKFAPKQGDACAEPPHPLVSAVFLLTLEWP
jgi:hypothetical protein